MFLIFTSSVFHHAKVGICFIICSTHRCIDGRTQCVTLTRRITTIITHFPNLHSVMSQILNGLSVGGGCFVVKNMVVSVVWYDLVCNCMVWYGVVW